RGGESEALVGPVADRGAVCRIDGAHADLGVELVFEGVEVRGEFGPLGPVRIVRGAAGSRRIVAGSAAGEGGGGERRGGAGGGEGPQCSSCHGVGSAFHVSGCMCLGACVCAWSMVSP